MRKLIWLLTLIAYVFGGAGVAYADVNSNMNSFWNSSLTSSNGRGPSAYQGQEAGYYSLGNYSYRTPVQTYTPYSVSLPSVKGGCGGIDMYGGSFSFINSDQIVAMFKNVAQNALGLLFQMAVKTLSELLGNEIEHMFDLVNSHNNAEWNSCAMAQSMINSVVDSLPQSTLKNCISIGLANHQYTDEAAARAACGFGGEAETTVNGATPTQNKSQPVNRNIAWEAIQKNPVFQGDTQLAELMMTLTGTFSIVVDTSASPATTKINATLPAGEADSYINALLDGNTALPIHQCLDSDGSCLHFSQYGTTANVQGLKPKIDALIDDMVQRIVNRQTLTPSEINLLGLSTIPLYKIASVEVAQNGLLASSEMKNYSEAIAQDILIGWIKQNIMAVQQGGVGLEGMDPTSMQAWTNNLRHVVDVLDQKEIKAQQRIIATQALIERTNQIEKTIAADTTSRFAGSILWAQTKRPG